jgi:hypothetical protein
MKRLISIIIATIAVISSARCAESQDEGSIDRLFVAMHLEQICDSTDVALHTEQVLQIHEKIDAAFGSEAIKPNVRKYLNRCIRTIAERIAQERSWPAARETYRRAYLKFSRSDIDKMAAFFEEQPIPIAIDLHVASHGTQLFEMLPSEIKHDISELIRNAKIMNRTG